jgi:hypothetical protein
MNLTGRDKIYLIGAFGAVLITALVHIGIREWYAPDIRYEEGSYYISGSTAVTSLKIKNYGNSDGEDIKINARFNKPISDISIDDRSITFNPLFGGIGKNSVSGQISNLVPDQEIFIYFAIDNSTVPEELPKRFLSQLTFKGGKGKTGEPILWTLLVAIAVLIIFTLLYVRFTILRARKDHLKRRERLEGWKKLIDSLTSEEYFSKVIQIDEMAKQAISKGDSRAIFEDSLNSYLKELKYGKILCGLGLKYFDSIRGEGKKN